MSDSENRLEHLQVENGMTSESPGNTECTGGGEVAEDQPACGEENNILEDEHGQFRRHREDPNSNVGYQEDLASNIGRLEDPLCNIGPDRHQFEEDPTRREARFPYVPEIHSVKKTQHDGKPDFPCVPEIHSVMKTQHDRKPDFPCVP